MLGTLESCLHCIINKRLQLGKTLYYQGDLSYIEAVNKEILKNSYQRLEEEGIIITAKSKESPQPPTMRVSPEWAPERDPETGKLLPQGKLWEFIRMIAQSRREGYVEDSMHTNELS